MRFKICLALFNLAILFGSSAFADSLPAGAKDLTESEVTALYSGNSFQWDKDNVIYFAADGTVMSTFSFGGSRGYTTGTWKVTGNEICKNTAEWFDVTKKTSGKGSPDCWRWAKKGKTYYMLQSVRFDGSKPDPNSWSRGENKKIIKGDRASKRIEALKAGT
jgi:Protein of unknown function (DUF995)